MIPSGRKWTRLVAISVLALSAGAMLSAQSKITVPERVKQLIAKRFPQVKVGDCNDVDTNSITFLSTTIQSNNGDISIHGFDFQGNLWTAQFEISPVADCQVWASDLTNNQRQDLIILAMGTNSSGGADSQISVLLFDENGRPFPWQATGNFSSDEDGVTQIVKQNIGTTAQIIVPKQEGIDQISYAYHLFSVANNRIGSSSEAGNSIGWPIMVSPTKSFIEEQQAYTPLTKDKHASSDVDAFSAKTVIAKIENPDSMQDEQLVLSNKKVVGYPKIIMQDNASGTRTINFDPTQAEIQQLKSRKVSIQTYGITCDGGYCQPLLLWAKE